MRNIKTRPGSRWQIFAQNATFQLDKTNQYGNDLVPLNSVMCFNSHSNLVLRVMT